MYGFQETSPCCLSLPISPCPSDQIPPKEVYWGTDGIWSEGCFVSTTGVNEEIIKRYIEMQGKEDAGQVLLELK